MDTNSAVHCNWVSSLLKNNSQNIKWSISPFLEVGLEKLFDSHMKNYIGKLKTINTNRFDTHCRNEWVILTCWISFTSRLEGTGNKNEWHHFNIAEEVIQVDIR